MPIHEQLFRRWMWRLPPAGLQVALTFDDGPDPRSTPRLLSTLDQLKIPATMFVLGERCAAHPELIRACAGAGHSVAVHGYTHQSFFWRSRAWQKDSIIRTDKAISDSGVKCHPLFRPPYGRFNPFTSEVLSEIGFTGVLWSQIVQDWVKQEPDQLSRAITSGLRDGNIIVLHDKPATIDTVCSMLPRLNDEVKSRGWQFSALSHSSLSKIHHL